MPPPSIIWALAIALVALLVYVSQDFVLLLLLSVTVAYLINPIVKIAESAMIKRSVAVTAIYLGIGIAFLITAYFVFPRLRAEVNTLSGNLPFFSERFDEAVDAIQNEIVANYPAADSLFTTREVRYEKLNNFIEAQVADVPGLLSHLATIVLAGVLVPFFSYFFLRDSRRIVRFVLDRLPPGHIETTVAVWCEIDRTVGRYLRGLAIEGMAVGVFAALGLAILGVNYPLLLGLVTGLANVVPYLGPIIGGATAILVALIQFKSLAVIAQVILLYLFVKFLDLVLIQPLAVGKGNDLHPVLLIASIIVGGHALGIIGMVIAVPTITILQRIAKLLFERRRYPTQLLDSHPTGSGQAHPYVC
ncbi:MAG TPA: AI-2E family transporter [Candidatus Binatia bacterium]|jgi:predicted PurR-regulated permease PerM